MSETKRRSAIERYRFPLILALYVAVCLPFCFLGYGSDNDSYQVVGAGKWVWEQHRLVTSRLPGYWVFETSVYWLNRLGGSLFVNLVSLLMGAGILWRLDRLRARLPGATITAASIFLILVPSFQIAASSCDDYLWSLLPLVFAFEKLLDRRDWQAGLWGALVVAVRPTNAVVLAGLFVGAALARCGALTTNTAWLKWPLRQRVASLLAPAAVSAVGLLPLVLSYRAYGNSFAFLHEPAANSPVFSWKMHAGRFGFKMLMVAGPLTFVVLLAGCFSLRRYFSRIRNVPDLALMGLGAVAANVLLFARFPLEISYLLPAVFFTLILLSFTVLEGHSRLTLCVLVALLISNAWEVNLAEPNVPNRASGARLGLSVVAGPVIEDMRARRIFIGCDSLDCWRERSGE